MDLKREILLYVTCGVGLGGAGQASRLDVLVQMMKMGRCKSLVFLRSENSPVFLLIFPICTIQRKEKQVYCLDTA